MIRAFCGREKKNPLKTRRRTAGRFSVFLAPPSLVILLQQYDNIIVIDGRVTRPRCRAKKKIQNRFRISTRGGETTFPRGKTKPMIFVRDFKIIIVMLLLRYRVLRLECVSSTRRSAVSEPSREVSVIMCRRRDLRPTSRNPEPPPGFDPVPAPNLSPPTRRLVARRRPSDVTLQDPLNEPVFPTVFDMPPPVSRNKPANRSILYR